MSRSSIRKEDSLLDWKYSSGRGEWRQWGTTVSYGPMVYEIRLKPNYGEREERGERGERKVPGALIRTKGNNPMGTLLCPQDQNSVVMHRLI